ncbi:MAG: nitroreductase [Halioglobus sp.]|jgi:nitroreductase
MEIYDVMRTTFAARDFTEDPVPDEIIAKILDNARFAPSGANRQGWRVVVVRSQKTKAALASMIEPTLQSYVAQRDAGEEPWNTINASAVSDEQISATKIPRGMVDKISYAPVVLLIFVDLSVVSSFDSELDRVGLISGASIYPFAWNILLGARNEGYGGTMTTFVVGQEEKLKELLEVPAEYACAAMIPLGKPVKQLSKLSRRPVAAFAVKEKFDGEVLGLS